MSARSHANLIIEDDPGIATSLRSGLEREGYQVTWKNKGEAWHWQEQRRLTLSRWRSSNRVKIEYCMAILASIQKT